MATLIKDRTVVPDSWLWLDPSATAQSLPADVDLAVTPAQWRDLADALAARPGRLALRLPGDAEVDALPADLGRFAMVEVSIPHFTDGRAYSLARTLRDRLRYGGELRATGDVQCDQIHYLSRCGFDAFVLRDGLDPADALRAFDSFSVTYQQAVGAPPLFRRREQVPA